MSNNLLKTLLIVLCTTVCAILQAQEVKGVITDVEGIALPGVSVIVDGTSNGTVSGADGSYSLKLKTDKSPVLVFSMIGLKTVYLDVDGRRTINVTMEEDSRFLDEVVVVGYQEVKRKDLLGAVASVSSNKIIEQPVTTVGQALAGRMAGVSVVTT